jgi:hypothetical protein
VCALTFFPSIERYNITLARSSRMGIAAAWESAFQVKRS